MITIELSYLELILILMFTMMPTVVFTVMFLEQAIADLVKTIRNRKRKEEPKDE